MKISTIKKLDDIAVSAVKGFDTEVKFGVTTRAQIDAVRKSCKHPTEIEVVKSMIRRDLKNMKSQFPGCADNALFKTLSNVMKTSEQANYLANSIVSKLKRRAWTDDGFEKIYREMFDVKPRA